MISKEKKQAIMAEYARTVISGNGKTYTDRKSVV